MRSNQKRYQLISKLSDLYYDKLEDKASKLHDGTIVYRGKSPVYCLYWVVRYTHAHKNDSNDMAHLDKYFQSLLNKMN